ncbi:hypothetical protein CcCBS67573_g08846, partial [Chytriomyces confervae]
MSVTVAWDHEDSSDDDDDSFYSIAPESSVSATSRASVLSSDSIDWDRLDRALVATAPDGFYDLTLRRTVKHKGSSETLASAIGVDEDAVINHHEEMRPVLFQPLASGVSALSQTARISLAVTGAVSGTILSTVRWTTALSLGIGRSIVVGALSSARIFRRGENTDEENMSSLEKITERSIRAVTDAFSLAELFTYGTWHLADSSVRFSINAATETIQLLDGVFGSTETSRAISSLVGLIQDEIRRGILHGTDSSSSTSAQRAIARQEATVMSTLGSIAVLGGVTKALTAFACLQAVTYRRSLLERKKVERVFDGVVDSLESSNNLSIQWQHEKFSIDSNGMDRHLERDQVSIEQSQRVARERSRLQELDEDDGLVTLDDAKVLVQETKLQGRHVEVMQSADSFMVTATQKVATMPEHIMAVKKGKMTIGDEAFLDTMSGDFAGKDMKGLVSEFGQRVSRDEDAKMSSGESKKAWSFFRALLGDSSAKSTQASQPLNSVNEDAEEEAEEKVSRLNLFGFGGPSKSERKAKQIRKRQSVITMFDQTNSLQQSFDGRNVERSGLRMSNGLMSQVEGRAFMTPVAPSDGHSRYRNYPFPHLLQNLDRYNRFSAAAYGAEFMKMMNMRSVHTTDNTTHTNHYAFSAHTGIPLSDILLSSFSHKEAAPTAPEMDTVIHYVALDKVARSVVVTLRGTFALNDIITDLKFDYADFMGHRAHSGMLRCAALLYKKGSAVRDVVRKALEENPTFGLVITGHSLGAGVAVLLALRWACPTSELGIHPNSPYHPPTPFVTSGRGGFPRGRPIHCYAYGSPCVVSLDLSIYSKGLVSTIVNGDDIVPTLSVGLVRDMKAVTMSLLDTQNRGLSERIIWKTLGFQATGGNQGNSKGERGEDYFWDVLSQLRGSMQNERLYVAGNAYNMVSSETVTTDVATQQTKSTFRVTLERCDDVTQMSQEPRFSSRLISDHLPPSYEKTMAGLMRAVFDMRSWVIFSVASLLANHANAQGYSAPSAEPSPAVSSAPPATTTPAATPAANTTPAAATTPAAYTTPAPKPTSYAPDYTLNCAGLADDSMVCRDSKSFALCSGGQPAAGTQYCPGTTVCCGRGLKQCQDSCDGSGPVTPSYTPVATPVATPVVVPVSYGYNPPPAVGYYGGPSCAGKADGQPVCIDSNTIQLCLNGMLVPNTPTQSCPLGTVCCENLPSGCGYPGCSVPATVTGYGGPSCAGKKDGQHVCMDSKAIQLCLNGGLVPNTPTQNCAPGTVCCENIADGCGWPGCGVPVSYTGYNQSWGYDTQPPTGYNPKPD